MESRRGALLFTLAVLAMLAADQGTSCPRADTLNRYTGYEINCALILLVCCRHCHPHAARVQAVRCFKSAAECGSPTSTNFFVADSLEACCLDSRGFYAQVDGNGRCDQCIGESTHCSAHPCSSLPSVHYHPSGLACCRFPITVTVSVHASKIGRTV